MVWDKPEFNKLELPWVYSNKQEEIKTNYKYDLNWTHKFKASIQWQYSNGKEMPWKLYTIEIAIK